MAVDGNGDGKITEHVESYNRFLGWLKGGTIAAAVVTVVVLLIIAR